MANLTYTGASSASPLVVTSSSVTGAHCEVREPPPSIPAHMGVSVGGYDLVTYQRLASALYPPPPLESTPSSPGAAPTHHALLGAHEALLHSSPLDFKDSLGSLGTAWPYPVYYPYETLAAYPFGPGYGMAFDAARRKNATRETTATLKAWLNEHKKNPYPTKGEKIMLAIITKMTLTQVSTWFANARRRLKKENKMTWEPRTKADEDDDDFDDRDDAMATDRPKEDDSHPEKSRDDCDVTDDERELERTTPLRDSSPTSTTCGPDDVPTSSSSLPQTSPVKPRIWSLADMAATTSSPSVGASAVIGASKFLHRPIHLETSPYGRPLPVNHRLTSPQETLLQVYAKSLGLATPHAAAAAFSPVAGLNGLASHLLPSSLGEPLPHSLVTSTPLLPTTISRPVATRSLLSTSTPPLLMPISHVLPGGAKVSAASSVSRTED